MGKLLLPLAFASCAASERLKELALPDQLHLLYEDQEAEYENKTIAGRGFNGEGYSLGVGLTWNLALPPEPAPGITREDLRGLILELRQEASTAAAAAAEASATARVAAAVEAAVAIEAAAAAVSARAAEAAAAVEAAAAAEAAARREEEERLAALAEPAPPDPVESETAAVEPEVVLEPVPPAVAPSAESKETLVASRLELDPAPSVPFEDSRTPASRRMMIPIVLAGMAVAALLMLQLTPGGRALLARLGRAHGKRT